MLTDNNFECAMFWTFGHIFNRTSAGNYNQFNLMKACLSWHDFMYISVIERNSPIGTRLLPAWIPQQVRNQGFANGGFDNFHFGEIQIPKLLILKSTNMWISVFRQELNTEVHIFVFVWICHFFISISQKWQVTKPPFAKAWFRTC